MTESRRRVELFEAPESGRRFGGPTAGDERAMLLDVLGAQRAALEVKCSGLGERELALRSAEPSGSLRWVLIHTIEECARHDGHADLLRERIGGAAGL